MNMNMNVNSKIVARILTIALMAGTVYGPKVFAADSTGAVRTQKVAYADLNLSSQAGITTLYQRIHQAAGQVCEEWDALRSINALQVQKACVARAEANAVKDVHSSALSAYYQMTLGHSYPMSALNNVK